MTKRYFDEEIYGFILKKLNENGINEEIINLASKMDTDLLSLFYEKIFCVEKYEELLKNVNTISKMLLGVYGNYLVSCYYKELGYDVKNEYEVRDNNTLVTRADIAFTDHNGKLNLCEVKATSQIIDNIRNYNSNDEEKYNDRYYYDKDKQIIRYKEIANKLIKQTSKLLKTNKRVIVIIFDGCFMDDIVRDKLNKMGATIFTLAVNINELERHVYDVTYKIACDLKDIKISKNIMDGK